MSSSSTTPATGLAMEEVFEVYLVAFDSAIAAFRPFSVASFSTANLGDDFTNVTLDLLSRDRLPIGTTDALRISYKKLNKCDIFCDMFYEETKTRLLPYQVNVEYAVVDPKPIHSLAIDGKKSDVAHSVLFIRAQDGSQTILDGTAEQFGWPASNAIIKGNEFWHHYTFGQKYSDGVSSNGLSLKYWKVRSDGYWYKIGISLREMLRDLDWEGLANMATVPREEYIRKESLRRALDAAKACWG